VREIIARSRWLQKRVTAENFLQLPRFEERAGSGIERLAWRAQQVATRSAIAAGYSKVSADQAGSRLLNIVRMKKLVDKYESERADRLKITDERLLEEAAKVALSNMQDFTTVNEDGQHRRFPDWTPDRACNVPDSLT